MGGTARTTIVVDCDCGVAVNTCAACCCKVSMCNVATRHFCSKERLHSFVGTCGGKGMMGLGSQPYYASPRDQPCFVRFLCVGQLSMCSPPKSFQTSAVPFHSSQLVYKMVMLQQFGPLLAMAAPLAARLISALLQALPFCLYRYVKETMMVTMMMVQWPTIQ